MTTEPDDEIAALKARIRDLEAALMLGDKKLRITFLLPPRLADILGLLVTQPIVSTEMLQHRLELASDAKVAVFRLRQHMKEYGIEIKSRNRIGYWLEEDAKARIRELIRQRFTSQVNADGAAAEAEPA